MSTDNNSLKTLYVNLPIVGPGVGLQHSQPESVEDSTLAQSVRQQYPTKINNSTTSVPLYSPISDSPHGTNTSQDYTFQRLDGQSYVLPATEQRQNKSEPLERKYEPNGESQKIEEPKGLKYDSNKPPLAYIPIAALWAEGEAFAYGAKKYDAWNYKNGIAVTRTLSAAMRHIGQFLEGEDNDKESGAHHLGSARANLAMALHTLANHPNLDDRFKKDSK